jgi:hypothetical protein
MIFCDYDTRRFFLFGMRIFFGAWLLYVGLVKWIMFGPEGFIGFITTDFDKTWSPHLLNVLLAWVILIAEPLVALWILSGIRARGAWMITSVLMFLLTIGQTILMKPTVTDNWFYVVITLACAALSEPRTNA